MDNARLESGVSAGEEYWGAAAWCAFVAGAGYDAAGKLDPGILDIAAGSGRAVQVVHWEEGEEGAEIATMLRVVCALVKMVFVPNYLDDHRAGDNRMVYEVFLEQKQVQRGPIFLPGLAHHVAPLATSSHGVTARGVVPVASS